MALRPSIRMPGSGSCNSSLPTPNSAPYTSTQPGAADRLDAEGDGGGDDREQRRREPRRQDVVRLAGVAAHEAAIEVVDEVARAPVELGGDGRHEGRRERRDHEPAERRRQVVD